MMALLVYGIIKTPPRTDKPTTSTTVADPTPVAEKTVDGVRYTKEGNGASEPDLRGLTPDQRYKLQVKLMRQEQAARRNEQIANDVAACNVLREKRSADLTTRDVEHLELCNVLDQALLDKARR